MKCENCNKFIWYWNDWRNRGAIVIDTRHPKYMLTIHWCSEKCYLEYSKKLDWLIKKPKNYKSVEEQLGWLNNQKSSASDKEKKS